MNVRMLPVVVLTMALPLVGCGGEAAIGEECDTPGGQEDVCEPGTVCGKYSDSAPEPTCLKICNDHPECNQAAGESCNGVEGTNIKGCRL